VQNDFVNAVAFSPDGLVTASGSGNEPLAFIGKASRITGLLESVHFWNETGTYLQKLGDTQPGRVTAVAFSPDSAHLVVGNAVGTVRLYRIR
jgi:WD40 repeat protein